MSHFFLDDSLSIIVARLLGLIWPILGVASVIAGIYFVKAVSAAYNWCFLIGSIIQVMGGSVFPFMTLINSLPDTALIYMSVSALNLVGGILIAYGIIGHGISYLNMIRLLNAPK